MSHPIPTAQCDLCYEAAEIADEQLNAYAKMFGDGPLFRSCILRELGLFRLIPALGALVHGHCILVPEFHFASFAELMGFAPRATVGAIGMAADLISEAYDSGVVAFEHGPLSVDCVRGRNPQDHAHIHLMPLNEDVSLSVREFEPELEWAQMESLEDLARLHRKASYLFYQFFPRLGIDRPAGMVCTFAHDNAVIKQFFRRVIADKLGEPENWRWEDDWREDNIRKTVDRLGLRQEP